MKNQSNHQSLPDIAHEDSSGHPGTLHRVGMRNVELPVLIRKSDNALIRVPSNADLFVSLDAREAKGIHMSRLYLEAVKLLDSRELCGESILELLKLFLHSHQGLSHESAVEFRYEYLRRQKSLLSENSGWRSYPVTLSGHLHENKFTFDTQIQVTYSSTCPCSSALSRNLIQNAFVKNFGKETVNAQDVYNWLGSPEGILATPHSQRSQATVTIRMEPGSAHPNVSKFIDRIEGALGTAVQAAVKREDEQEFARLNGQNPMFCEDACRRIKQSLLQNNDIADFRIVAEHFESLHPHDAVAISVKGVPNGFLP